MWHRACSASGCRSFMRCSLWRHVAYLACSRAKVFVGWSHTSVGLLGESLERSTVQLNKSLADNRLHLTITLLHVHHHRDGHTTGNPLVGRSCRILHDSHVACLTIGNELSSRSTQSIAVVSVEVRRSSATSLISEEVVQGRELAGVLASGQPS